MIILSVALDRLYYQSAWAFCFASQFIDRNYQTAAVIVLFNECVNPVQNIISTICVRVVYEYTLHIITG